ncbi:MAG: hypothetical protein HY943_21130 [Gammaproteobacteria bacterium]|nr:hypothetical protein [Gammaproteobacteria bacterium]
MKVLKKAAAAIQKATAFDRERTIEDTDPELQEALRAVKGIRDQLQDVILQLRAIDSQPQEPRIKGQIERLLAGESIDAVDVPESDTRSEFKLLQQRRVMLEAALGEAERRAQKARSAAVRRHVDGLIPEARALQERTARALIELGLANEAAAAFLSRLQEFAGVDWPAHDRHYGPMGAGRVGDPLDEGSLFGVWLASAVAAGAIDVSVLPVDWRQGWGVLRDLEKFTRNPDQPTSVLTKLARYSREAGAPSARQRSTLAAARRAGARNGS